MNRPHSDQTAGELLAKEDSYKELQRKTSSRNPQLEFGFDAIPPSRSDAKRLVEQRRQTSHASKASQTKVVGSMGKDGIVKKNTAGPDSKKDLQTKASSASSGKGKKNPGPKKAASRSTRATRSTRSTEKPNEPKRPSRNQPFGIQLTLRSFIVLVLCFAVLLGSVIARTILDRRAGAAKTVSTAIEDSQSLHTVVIEPGMSARQVASLLEGSQVVDSAKAFERYLESNGGAKYIQPGTYRFQGLQSYASVADSIVKPAVRSTVEVMVYAGYTLQDIDTWLSQSDLAESGAFVASANRLATANALPFAEGWFLSGTYTVSTANAAGELATKMYQAMLEYLHPHLGTISDADRPLAHIIIVASMIQRETNNTAQMPHIAGIIYKRLDAHIPLGIDATTRYELNDWKNPLQEADLNAQTPYNTRRKTGLPPSGIGCPSTAALLAAIHPAENEWYYYLHGNDKSIHYAVTYEEHKENIKRYL